MNNLEQILNDFGREVVRQAKLNIGQTKTVKNWKGKNVKRRIDDTGKLRKSVNYQVKVHPKSFSFFIEMEDYGVDIDQGKKAGGVPANINSLKKWIRHKPARLRDIKGQFIKMDDLRVTSFAEHIQYTHQKYGTAATNFLSEPFEKAFKDLPDELIEAFGLDIEAFLETSLSELNKKYK